MGNHDFVDTIDPQFTSPSTSSSTYIPPKNTEKMVNLIVSGDTNDVNYVDVTVNRCSPTSEDCDFVGEISYGTGGTGPCGPWLHRRPSVG